MTRLEGEIMLAYSDNESVLQRRTTSRLPRHENQQSSSANRSPVAGSSSASPSSGSYRRRSSSRVEQTILTNQDGAGRDSPGRLWRDVELHVNPFEPEESLSEHETSENQTTVDRPEETRLSDGPAQELEVEACQARQRQHREQEHTVSENAISTTRRRCPDRSIPSTPIERSYTMYSTTPEPPTSPAHEEFPVPTPLQAVNQQFDASQMLASVMRSASTSVPSPSRPHTVYSTTPEPPAPSSVSFRRSNDALHASPPSHHYHDVPLPPSPMTPSTAGAQLTRANTFYSDIPEPPTPSRRSLAISSRTSFSLQEILPLPTSSVPPLPPKPSRSSIETAESESFYSRRYGPLPPPAFVVVDVSPAPSPLSRMPPTPSAVRRQQTASPPPVPPRPSRLVRSAPPPPVPSRSPPVSPTANFPSDTRTSEDNIVLHRDSDEPNRFQSRVQAMRTQTQRQLPSPIVVAPRSHSDPLPQQQPPDRSEAYSAPRRPIPLDPLVSPSDEEAPPPAYDDIVAGDVPTDESAAETQSEDIIHDSVSSLEANANTSTRWDTTTTVRTNTVVSPSTNASMSPRGTPPNLRMQLEPDVMTASMRSRVISMAGAPAAYECPLCLEDEEELSNITCGHVFCTP